MRDVRFIKYLLATVGAGTSLGLTLVLTGAYFAAFTHGDKVLITINQYGEKWGDLVCIIVALVLGIWSIIYLMLNYGKLNNKK